MKKLLIFISPLILLLEIMIFNCIVDLLRQPSDMAVMAGVGLVCIGLTFNFYLIKIIKKQFKQ